MKHRYIVMDASETSITLEKRHPASAGTNDASWMRVPVTAVMRGRLRGLLREFEREVSA